MIRSNGGWIGLVQTLILAGVVVAARADVGVNPFSQIVERNPFGLKPIPPRLEEAPPPPAPPPLATVKVTGVLSILSSKRVLLEITPGPGKPLIKPILAEGERVESVEVLAINVEKSEVTIRNGTLVTNMTFEVVKSSPSGAAPSGQPAGFAAAAPAPAQTAASTALTHGGFGRGSIMVAGGGASGAGSGAAPANPGTGLGIGGGAGVGDYASSAASSGAAGVAEGLRQIPSRNLRSGQGGGTGVGGTGAPYSSREEQAVLIEVNREISRNSPRRLPLPPLPPTPLNPNPGR